MNKFIIHTEWVDYYSRLSDSFYHENGSLRDAGGLLDSTLEALIVLEQITRYVRNGKFCFADNKIGCRAKAMFLSLKPQIDADLELLRRSDELQRKDGDYEHD